MRRTRLRDSEDRRHAATEKTVWRKTPVLVGLLAFIPDALAIAYVYATRIGVGSDWQVFLYHAGRAYLSGGSRLYDLASGNMYNPPWTIPILLPFLILPLHISWASFLFLNLMLMAYAILTVMPEGSHRSLVLIGLLLSPLVWETILIGNVEALVLLGLLLMYQATIKRKPWMLGLALVLATLKPQVVVLPALLLLLKALRWSSRELAAVAAAPALALVSSLFIAGVDWPLRYLQLVRNAPPGDIADLYNISVPNVLKRGAEMLSLPSWPVYIVMGVSLLGVLWCATRVHSTKSRMALAVAAGPVVVNYLTPMGLSLQMIWIWPQLVAQREYWLAAVVYSLQFPVVLRAPFGYPIDWVLCIFSIAAFGAALHANLRAEVSSPNENASSSISILTH